MERTVEQHLKDQANALSERAPHDALWQAVAQLCLPRDAVFSGANSSPGRPRNEKIYDDYGVLALDRGNATFTGLVMPRGSRWQILESPDRELMKLRHVAAWFEQKTQRLFDLRNEPGSGYVQQADLSVSRLMAMGNQSIWVDIRKDYRGLPIGLSYRSEPLNQITIGCSWQGRVDVTRQEFTLTAEQAVRRWGEVALQRAGAEKILGSARDAKRRHNPMRFLNVIMPNDRVDPERLDWRGRPFIGTTIAMDDKVEIERGGYRSSPRTYSRYKQSPGEVYGRGRGVDALPTLRACQALQIDIMVAGELTAQPMLGAPDDGLDNGIQYGPREILIGAINPKGEKLVQPIMEGIDIAPLMAMQQRMHERLDQYFYVDLYMAGDPTKSHVSAQYWMQRAEERGILLAPLAQQESEWFSPMLDREIDCMAQMGDFDDMPEEVREAGGEKTVRYANPLARLQEAEGAAGLFRTVEQIAPLAAVKPDIIDYFLTEYPTERWIPELARINGAPATWRATDEERKASQDAAVQQAQIAQLTQVLPAIAKSANDLSAAEGTGDAAIV